MSAPLVLIVALWVLTLGLGVILRRMKAHEQTITPWRYFFGAAATWAIVSIAGGFLGGLASALKVFVVGVGGLALVTWGTTWRRNKYRDWILTIVSIGLIAGWLLFKTGVAGFPEALARMCAMVVIFGLLGILPRRFMPKIRRPNP